MPKLVLAVFCQQAVVDRFTNNLSIINQLDSIHPPRPPANVVAGKGPKKKPRFIAAFPCALVSIWEREKPSISESSELLVELLGPAGESLAKFQAPLDLRKHRRVRHLGNVPAIPLVGEGTYQFLVHCRVGVKWRKAGAVSFELAFQNAKNVH